ncbi:MAG: hypothetical protein ABSB89_09180 [Candidatus Bathyarchaeia archaeon]|jgi:hypothetical protein
MSGVASIETYFDYTFEENEVKLSGKIKMKDIALVARNFGQYYP